MFKFIRSRKFFKNCKEKKSYKIFILIFLFILLMWFWPVNNDVPKYGTTFSSKYATELELDPKKVLRDSFEELSFDKVRLVAYWDEIEKERDIYDFSDLDWQIEMAVEYDAEIILSMGRRVPRWPECHIPDWARQESRNTQNEQVLELLEEIITRYKDVENIKYWQIENEPFLSAYAQEFCGKYTDINLLESEIALVRSLDDREIILTDSGELSLWHKAYKRGDVFGSTLYIYVANEIVGDIRIPVNHNFYNWKLNIMKWIFGEKKTILIELSLEPWLLDSIIKTPINVQLEKMNLEKVKKVINTSRQTKFDDQYLWGVEWWYFLKENNHPEIWDYIKDLQNK